MSLVKVALVCALGALALSACGIQKKPEAGSNLSSARAFYGKVDDPRGTHAACIAAAGLPVHEYYTRIGKDRMPAIQVGTLPTGPTIVFYPTPGVAQGIQIMDGAQGAEVIGAALLYPNKASASVLGTVEGCTAIGVTSGS